MSTHFAIKRIGKPQVGLSNERASKTSAWPSGCRICKASDKLLSSEGFSCLWAVTHVDTTLVGSSKPSKHVRGSVIGV